MVGNLPMASKNGKFTAYCARVLKENNFEPNGTKRPCCLTVWLKFVTLWSNEHGNVQSLHQLCRVWCFWANMAVLAVYRGQNQTDCLVLGINWLTPTSNNAKHTPWDPMVFGFLNVQGPLLDSWLVLLPGVWAMYEPVMCTRILGWELLLSFQALNQLWTFLGYPRSWSSSLSATDLVFLSEEELVHRCHHVLVQINKMCVVNMLSVQALL